MRAIIAGLPDPLNGTTLSSRAMQALMRWKWLGNLAELEKTLQGVARRRQGGLVQIGDLPARFIEAAQHRKLTPIETAERDAVIAALTQTQGNRSVAAKILGIGRTTLYRKIRTYHIDDSEALNA